MTKDNITMAAVKAYFTSVSGAKPVAKTGFSSATKYSSVTFEEGGICAWSTGICTAG